MKKSIKVMKKGIEKKDLPAICCGGPWMRISYSN